ncbi:MAG: helix-turn-helix domain-containing protein [Aeromonas veronii]
MKADQTERKIEIGRRIKHQRRARGWTLEEMGKELGVSGPRISNWEQGTRTPSIEQLSAMADLFGVSGSYLAAMDGDKGRIRDYVVTAAQNVVANGGAVILDGIVARSALSIEHVEAMGWDPEKLVSVEQSDNALGDLIPRGAEVLIDKTQQAVTCEDLFAILVGRRAIIRWLRPEIMGGYTMWAGNERQSLTAEELAALCIIGRVCRISVDR